MSKFTQMAPILMDRLMARFVDSTHGCHYREMAQQVFACMKNN